ncbi:hypothetical protein [uncultured Devosia sp.]|uniref:hypothetical protein n=1 Tax=uncultured Devosia sp. TaxID=211434 RepID=UPI00260931B4|nr:hypothetical protein [uncultured Devosia sp.]
MADLFIPKPAALGKTTSLLPEQERRSVASSGAEIARLLRSVRLSVAVESEAQAEIADALKRAGLPAVREVILDAQNRIDLMVADIGIEVKVKGDRRAIYRQLRRYCEFPQLAELVLVTGRAMSLPAEINGRAIHLVSMGRAWL